MCYIITGRSKKIKKGETTTFLYYLIQVLLSIIIIRVIFYRNIERIINKIIVVIAVLGKIGMWPLHGWYIKLISNLEIKQSSIIIVITWQKVLPIILILSIKIRESIILWVMLILTITLIASLSRLEKKFEIKKIIAVSSINNNSWILIRRLVSVTVFSTFIIIYSTSLVLTLSYLEKIAEKVKTIGKRFWVNVLIIRNLSGLPPLAIFWAKVIIIKELIRTGTPSELALLMIISACFLIYHYLWIILNEISHSPEKSQIKIKTKKEVVVILLVLGISVARLIILITSGLT